MGATGEQLGGNWAAAGGNLWFLGTKCVIAGQRLGCSCGQLGAAGGVSTAACVRAVAHGRSWDFNADDHNYDPLQWAVAGRGCWPVAGRLLGWLGRI